MGHERDYSDVVAAEIDGEVRSLIELAHDEAWEILVEYRDVLDNIVLELIEKETISTADLARICARVPASHAEAIRAAYASLSVTFEGAPLGPLSLSAGVSVLPPDDADWPQAMRRADRALYAAKEQGRDRIVSA